MLSNTDKENTAIRNSNFLALCPLSALVIMCTAYFNVKAGGKHMFRVSLSTSNKYPPPNSISRLNFLTAYCLEGYNLWWKKTVFTVRCETILHIKCSLIPVFSFPCT